MAARWCYVGLVSAVLLASSSIAWSQSNSTAPKAGANPGVASSPVDDLGAMMQLSQRVQDYFSASKQDAARAEQYLRGIEGELVLLGPRIEALGAQWDLIPTAITGSSRFSKSDELASLERAENEVRLAIEENSKRLSALAAAVPKALDQRAFNPAEHAKNAVYFGSMQRSLAGFPTLERSLLSSMEISLSRLLALHALEAEWQVGLLQAQAGFDRGRVHERYLAERAPFWDAHQTAFWQNAHETGYGSAENIAFGNTLDKAFEAQIGPLCRRANEEDALFLPKVGAGFQAIIDRMKAAYRRSFDNFHQTTDQIFADKSGSKAEIGAEADRWFQEHSKLSSNSNLWGRGAIGGGHTGVAWVVALEPSFYELPDNENPAMLPCRDWRDQMPEDLETQFPALTVEFQNRQVIFSASFDKPQKEAHVAQGGRWPQEGP